MQARRRFCLEKCGFISFPEKILGQIHPTESVQNTFLGKDHLDIFEEKETRSIAAVQIHVERAISRIKTFKILSSVFPIRMAADMNKVWLICSYLTNILPPLIADENSTK